MRWACAAPACVHSCGQSVYSLKQGFFNRRAGVGSFVRSFVRPRGFVRSRSFALFFALCALCAPACVASARFQPPAWAYKKRYVSDFMVPSCSPVAGTYGNPMHIVGNPMAPFVKPTPPWKFAQILDLPGQHCITHRNESHVQAEHCAQALCARLVRRGLCVAMCAALCAAQSCAFF